MCTINRSYVGDDTNLFPESHFGRETIDVFLFYENSESVIVVEATTPTEARTSAQVARYLIQLNQPKTLI